MNLLVTERQREHEQITAGYLGSTNQFNSSFDSTAFTSTSSNATASTPISSIATASTPTSSIATASVASFFLMTSIQNQKQITKKD